MKNFQSIGPVSVYGDKEFFLSENGYCLTDLFGGPTAAKCLEKFEARDDDVFVVSFPKTGTTWMQEIVYLIGSNLDFEGAKTIPMMTRCPYMELIPNRVDVSTMPSPRFLKFHYGYSMLPQSIIDKKCKIICPVRNPKDTLISYYHFSKSENVIGFNGDLATFVDYFVNDRVLYSPFWKFMSEFWERRNDENIMLVAYEEMIQNLPKVVERTAKFMGKNLSQKNIIKIAEFCSFDSMKKNFQMDQKESKSDYNSIFFRKGKVGDWRNHLNEEMNKKIDDYLKKHFSSSDMQFMYE